MPYQVSNKLQVASRKPKPSRTDAASATHRCSVGHVSRITHHASRITHHASRITFYALALLLLWTLSACTAKVIGDEPPVIAYGQDVCDRCGMIIEESRFAAAYVTPQGDVRRFDDIGDMVTHYQETGEEAAVFWVHDYSTEEWLKASEAYFVVSEDLLTPMGSGILAAADQNTANSLAADWSGETLTFNALLARAQAGLVEGHDQHHHAMPHEHGG